ncbi:MAG: intradiol ring-cleavage dioxygenase [Rhodospirillales bacterium]|jgi:catechol 1,2-dioxygenase|nr:intradiol ring-cleavage dioxygenase [Rhodospirillales bacterium]MDP6774520.1 intradiol ring-cleavage dioxygenase [Rhodospirillales bacterium]
MRNLTEDNMTDAVIAGIGEATDARLKEIMVRLVGHLHDFVREVELTEEEWLAGIRFLTAVGQKCDDRRQEFILLSDVLGVSILMDAINNRKPAGATESSVLGPFYREGAEEMAAGANLSKAQGGEPCIVSGRVTGPGGTPIAGALLDVWQTAPNGLYETQDPQQPDFNLRGKLRTDTAGRYEFHTVKPVTYPIPDDGPAGRLLGALGRHSYRPAHIHFIVSAPGYVPVTTQIFTEGDPYLDSDAVFGVKSRLVARYVRHETAADAVERGVTAPFHTVDYDFELVAEG